MRHPRLSTLLLCILCSSAVHVAAQEPPAEEPPPEPELTEDERAWQARFERAEGFRFAMLQTRRGVELFLEFRDRNAEAMAANRQRCREDLRRASRGMQFSTLLACYRREMALHAELLKKQRQYAGSIPGVSEERRTTATEKLDQYATALEAVEEGLATGVFEAEEQLLEARQNLHRNYRVPALLALRRLEADRKLTWVAHLMHRLLTATQNTELGPEAFSRAAETMACFERGEEKLRAAMEPESYEDTNFLFSQSLTHLQNCVRLLDSAYNLQQNFENPPAEEPADENLSPRRRWGS